MCQYITITLPKETDLNVIRPTFEKYNLSQRVIENKAVAEQIRKDDLYVNTTSNMCDCGSIVASNSQKLSTDQKYKSDIQRMKKKGWSDTKISRWVEQKQNGVRNKELAQDNERWIGFIKELIIDKQIGRLGLLIHWYGSAGLEDEIIEIQGITNIKVDSIDENTLEQLEYDHLYHFIK